MIDDFDRLWREAMRMLGNDFSGGYMRSNDRWEKLEDKNYMNSKLNIFDFGDYVALTSFWEGFEDDYIKVIPKEDTVEIQIFLDGEWHTKHFPLYSKVNPDTAKITFKNYVLDVELEKVDEDVNGDISEDN